MISICIPVYNFNIVPLVQELSRQMQDLTIDNELIIIDDASTEYQQTNKEIARRHRYIPLEKNIGRAKIRNLFLEYAQYEYLLFLDCDALVDNPSFLANYVEAIQDKPALVCGGRVYDTKRPKRDKMLRWKYGIQRESQPCDLRRKFPNQSFMTNNFLVQKSILAENKFDERIAQYGHEDTLFGLSLKKKNISITHIDNPVINGDIESNEVYLQKTKQSVMNLIHILHFTTENDTLMDDISLLRFYKKIQKIEPIIALSFSIFQPLVVFLLQKGYVNLYLFDYYKLGIFITNKQK